ncbi:MAG: peptidase serine carboxypeptidase [Xanthobacteraceae bacterium]|jgi:carboxypeptidase C (cathepsin A)|nr:peptidase serine carboxypeptidase [Xanthobacteraceae bacterium]
MLLLGFANAPAMAERPQEATGVLALLPADSVTEHTLDLGGEKLSYSATAGTLALFDQNGERSAAIFYTAYTLKGAEPGTRPVTFVFNGGPGAASAYLHLGVVGPQVVDFKADGNAAEARLHDNRDTWLKFTDLVLIDPVGAGWSRAAKADKANDFWGVDSDASTLAKVIALYTAKNSRSASPKYLLGESYGGFRSVKVARALQEDQGILINGIVMLSPFLEGRLQFGANRFALGAALQLPSLAAAALDRKGSFTPEALASAERFALTDYLTALAGKPLEGEAAKTFYAKVAEISGVPLEAVTRTRGLIGDAYTKNDDDRVASSYDAATLAPDPFPESASDDGPDPVLDGYTQALGGLFVGYARDQLGFKTDMTFNLLNREVSGKWDWGRRGSLGSASISRDLRELLALNPKLNVLVAHGRSDVVTPYGVTRYVIDHMPPLGPAKRLDLKLYKGGHMFYFDPASRSAFAADAGAFYAAGEL